MSLISIIVPAYNTASFIERTLSSIVEQDVPDIEVVIVDDGSTDDTLEVIETFFTAGNSTRLKKIIVSQVNSGVSAARNRGLSLASGKYVLFLDFDDLLNVGVLRRFIEAAETTSADIVIGGYELANESGITLREVNSEWFSGTIAGETAAERILKSKLRPWTASVLYRREFLISKDLKYQRGCNFGEDSEFTIKLVYRAETVACFPDTVYKYIQRGGSLSNKNDLQVFHYPASKRRLLVFFTRAQEAKLARIIESRYLPYSFLVSLNLISVNKDLKKQFKQIAGSMQVRRIMKRYFQLESNQRTLRLSFDISLLLLSPSVFLTYRNIVYHIKRLFRR